MTQLVFLLCKDLRRMIVHEHDRASWSFGFRLCRGLAIFPLHFYCTVHVMGVGAYYSQIAYVFICELTFVVAQAM